MIAKYSLIFIFIFCLSPQPTLAQGASVPGTSVPGASTPGISTQEASASDCVVFENAVKTLPSDIEAWQNWSKCEGEPQNSSQNPKNKQQAIQLAKQQARQIEILQQAAAANPKNTQILLFWANTLQGFVNQGASQANEQLGNQSGSQALNPANNLGTSNGTSNSGQISRLDKWRWYFQASELLKKALALEFTLEGENPETWQALSTNYAKLAEQAEFSEQADFLRQASKNSALKATNLKLKRDQLAPIPQFCPAEFGFAQSHPENPAAWASLAACLQGEAKQNQEISVQAGIVFNASASYQQLARLQPNNFELLFAWGKLLFNLANRQDYTTTQGREVFQAVINSFEAGLKFSTAPIFKNWALAAQSLQEVRKTSSSSRAWLNLAKQLELVIANVETSGVWDEYQKLQTEQPIWKQIHTAYTRATQLSPSHLQAWQGRATAAMAEYQIFAAFNEPSMIPVYLLRDAADSYAQIAQINPPGPAAQQAEVKKNLALLELASRLEDPYQKFVLLQAIANEALALPKNQAAYFYLYLAGAEALMNMAALAHNPQLQQEYIAASNKMDDLEQELPFSFINKIKTLRAAINAQTTAAELNSPNLQNSTQPINSLGLLPPPPPGNATASMPETAPPVQPAVQPAQPTAELPDIIKRLKLNPNHQAEWDLWLKKAIEQIKFAETLEGQTKGGLPPVLEALFAPVQSELELLRDSQTWQIWQTTMDALVGEFKQDSAYLIRARALNLSRFYSEKHPQNYAVWTNLAWDLLKMSKLAVDSKEQQNLIDESCIAVERGLEFNPSPAGWELWRSLYSDYSPIMTNMNIRKQRQMQALARFEHRVKTIDNSTIPLENWGTAVVELAGVSKRQKDRDSLIKQALGVQAKLAKLAPQDFASSLRWSNTLQKTLAFTDSPFVKVEILEQLAGLASGLANLIPTNPEYRLKAANAMQQWGVAVSDPALQYSIMSRAHEYYSKAFELDPNSPEILENWGKALLQYSNTPQNKQDKTMQRHYRAVAVNKFAEAVDVSINYDLARRFAQWGTALVAQSELAENQDYRFSLQKEAYTKFQIAQDMSNYYQPDLQFWLNWSDTLQKLATTARDDQAKLEFFDQANIQLEQAIWHFEAAENKNNYTKQQLFEAWAKILAPNSNYPLTPAERQILRDKASQRYKIRTIINQNIPADKQFFFSRHLAL